LRVIASGYWSGGSGAGPLSGRLGRFAAADPRERSGAGLGRTARGLSCRVLLGRGSEMSGDWVQIHQRSGETGLERGFLGADVAALAGAVTDREQTE